MYIVNTTIGKERRNLPRKKKRSPDEKHMEF